MTRLTLGAVIGVFFVASAQAQGTKPDTALAVRVHLTATDSLRLEANRRQGPRKTVVLRLTGRVDSLLAAHLKPVAPPDTGHGPPPDTTHTPPPDTLRPPPDTVKPPPPDSIIVADSGWVAAAPELPKTVPAFTIPAPTRTVRVPAPGVIRSILSTITFGIVDAADLQDALDKAQPGDEIVLPSGAVYKGNYWLPTKACNGWVTVRSDAPLPAPSVRVDTVTARAYAKLVTESNQPALRTRNPTCQWNLVGIEITGTLARTSQQYGLLWLGDGGWREGGETQVALDLVPQQIVVDRAYIHGTRDLNLTRCVSLQSAQTIIRDSFISECHVLNTQGQAIAVWNSPGPLLIENSFISGAGQNLLFGGADPGIDGLIPSDITVRRNHFWKDPAWKGVYPASFLLESKNSQRTLFEANVFDNTWASAQSGMAIGFKSQSGNEQGRLMWQGTTDVTFRWNIVRCAQRGLNLQAVGEGGSDRHVARVQATDNLFDKIGLCNGVQPTDGWLSLLTQDLKDILIARNNFIGNAPGYGLDVYFANGGGGARMDIRGNLFAGQSYYAIGSDNGLHTQALNNFYGTSWRFSGNVISQVDAQFAALSPPNNVYVDAVAKLGLRADGSSANYPNAGVNVAELLRRTAGVVP